MNSKPPTVSLKKYSRLGGFSLLEAIVALALISLTGMAVFSWINQSLGNLSKLDRVQVQSQRLNNSFAYIKTINPMLTPSGSTQLGETILSWTSQLIEQPNQAVGRLGNFTTYQVGLYQLNITLEEDDLKEMLFSVRQVGYREP